MTVTPPPDGLGHVSGAHKDPVPRFTGPLVVTAAEETALEAVRDRMREGVTVDGEKYGVDCPLCGQLAKVYRRSISTKACQLLVLLYCAYGPVDSFLLWQDGNELWGGSPPFPSDAHHLVWWALLDPVPQEYDRRTGYEVTAATDPADIDIREVPGLYTISHYAEKFLRGEIAVPGQCRIYDGSPLSLVEDVGLDIFQGTGHEFDLAKLLAEPNSDARRSAIYGSPKVKRPRRARGHYS